MCIMHILNFLLNVRNYYNPHYAVNTREYEFLQFDIWIQYQLLVEHKSGDPSSNTTFCFSTKLTDSKNNNHEKQWLWRLDLGAVTALKIISCSEGHFKKSLGGRVHHTVLWYWSVNVQSLAVQLNYNWPRVSPYKRTTASYCVFLLDFDFPVVAWA